MARSRVQKKDLPLLAALAAVYFVTGKLGLNLAFVNASVTALWTCTGIALAAFLILGYRVWPAILTGAFLVNLTTTGSVATSISSAVGNTLEGMVGCYLVTRFGGGRNTFERSRDIFKSRAKG
jgi:integral membrane sensor domain MASE1